MKKILKDLFNIFLIVLLMAGIMFLAFFCEA